MVTIDQPNLINEYNHRMGGVDLFDNAMNNYRIRVRGKKWYWPLITNAIDAAMVNAWKLHVLCRKYDGGAALSQLDFRVEVAEAIITKLPKKTPSGKKAKSSSELGQRMDRIGHDVMRFELLSRCRQCGLKTKYGCSKCVVHVHSKDCFVDYHNNVAPDQAKLKKAK